MKLKKTLSAILAVIMVMMVFSVSVLAVEIAPLSSSNGLTPDHMTVIQDKISTLAPGVTQREVAMYDCNGDRVEMLVAIADMDVDTVKIFANYKDNQNQVLGMQKTTEQVAAAVAKHQGENYNPVVAINASYYNTGNGCPTGAFVMEGIDATAAGQGMAYPFFAVLKNGEVMIGSKGEYNTYKDQIQEAIGGYIHLVKDGAVCSGLNKVEKYPRQTIGITADNKVIIMTSDGNQAPKSIGMTIQEQAEVMLAMGCVEALHLDGGGSATYCAKPEGSDKLVVLNSPSNGSERAVSNTLMIVSTAAPDGAFHHAGLSVENEFVTPKTSVKINAVGVDAAGGSAEIPENALFQLVDSSFGTVTDDIFVSNGKLGDAVVQMIVDGEIVGSVTIHVVMPDGISFSKAENVIPYDKTVKLDIKATYGVYDVALKVEDLSFEVDAGTISGFEFTAPSQASGVTSTNIKATLVGTELVATSKWTFGRASEVLFDFEEGTAGSVKENWVVRTHESNTSNNEHGEVFIVNNETGLVHSGDQALAFNVDMSQCTGSGSSTAGYIAMSMGWLGDAINIKGAQRLGFWIYIPDDAMTTEITLNVFYKDSKGVVQRRTVDAMDDNGEAIYTPYWKNNMEKSGWRYVSVDLSKFGDDLFIHDEPSVSGAYKRNFFIKMYCVFGQDTIDFSSFHGNFTYYIDDITVDYSSAVDDRELPVFSSSTIYGEMEGSSANLLHGKTVDVAFNNMMFSASVADNTVKSTYTGLDISTSKIYVDGVAVSTYFANGVISSDYVSLADGLHTVTYEIADNMGNVGTIVRKFNVKANSELPKVQLVPQNPKLDRLLSGSVYWLDLVATDLDDVDSVEVLLNLNSINNWELEHMEVAKGFTATYYATAAMEAEYNVLVKFERNGQATDGSNILASIPVRVWESLVHLDPNNTTKTPEYMWKNGNIDSRDLRVGVDMGIVTYTDGTTATFSSFVRALHEGYTHYYNMDKEYHAQKGSFHVHTPYALQDLDANCTESGYTGRTYCDECDSVVDWGTTLSATGHTYENIDGVLKCECGELFTGIYTDGKTYENGILVAGWCGDSYYVEGVALTGVKLVDDYYYDFGENGVCAGKVKYNGLFYDETVSAYRFAKMGELESGWQLVEGNWHLFRGSKKLAATGEIVINGIKYQFNEQGMTKGAWHTTEAGTRYYYSNAYHKARNPEYQMFVEIDGKTYNFDYDGYLTKGIHALRPSAFIMKKNVFEFDEDGVLIGQITTQGLIKCADGGTYYINEEGYIPTNAGLVQNGEDYYFVVYSGKVAINSVRNLTEAQTNGLLPAGTYTFGADGKMVKPQNGIVEEDGDFYYYIDGVKQKNSGLVKIDGDYYFVCYSGKLKQNNVQTITESHVANYPEISAGTYYFGADCKMVIPEKEEEKDGIVEENGVFYYYINGVKQKNLGLVKIDGDYYFVCYSGKLKQNNVQTITESHVANYPEISAGTYYFGADCKMIAD